MEFSSDGKKVRMPSPSKSEHVQLDLMGALTSTAFKHINKKSQEVAFVGMQDAHVHRGSWL